MINFKTILYLLDHFDVEEEPSSKTWSKMNMEIGQDTKFSIPQLLQTIEHCFS